MASAAPVSVGQVLAGKYRVDGILGLGGMGVVVAATHVHLDQIVALKFMLPHVLGNSEAVARFIREARAVVRLRSQHVARVFDVGTLDDGSPYIVMEHLEGVDLAEAIAHDGKMPATRAADIVLQACDAVAEAHSLGIVHRDLKSPNIFLSRTAGGALLVKVLDFGIAKAVASDQAMTRTATILGSPAYMAPEQMRSSREVDGRADIWSLGVILYEAVAGRLPFAGEIFTDVAFKVMMEPPAPLNVRGLPRGFATVIDRCLEKDPARRYPDVGAFATALARFASPGGVQLAARIRGILASTGAAAPAVDHARHRAGWMTASVLGLMMAAAGALVVLGPWAHRGAAPVALTNDAAPPAASALPVAAPVPAAVVVAPPDAAPVPVVPDAAVPDAEPVVEITPPPAEAAAVAPPEAAPSKPAKRAKPARRQGRSEDENEPVPDPELEIKVNGKVVSPSSIDKDHPGH